jgi:hypothetical protein
VAEEMIFISSDARFSFRRRAFFLTSLHCFKGVELMKGRVATLSRISSSRRLPGFLTNHYLLAIAGSVDEPVLNVTVNDAAVAVAGQAFSLDYLLAEGREYPDRHGDGSGRQPGGANTIGPMKL